jgi:uncharacterized protein
MRINLKDAFILDRYEKDVEFQLSVGEDEDLNTLASFPEAPKVRFSIRGKYGMVMCKTEIDFKCISFCSRCLCEVCDEIRIENERRMITDPLKEDEDTILLESNLNFDPEQEAKNQIIMEFPERFLCSEDCKGLCPNCGCNLNESECNCRENSD